MILKTVKKCTLIISDKNFIARKGIITMKKILNPNRLYFKWTIKAIFVLISILIWTNTSSAQLSGTRTVGIGRDYTSITAAVTALTAQGVNGPVVFNISDNMTYNEQIVIGPITGASASNTITFQSDPANSSNATIQFMPTVSDNYLIRLNGADYITFQNLTMTSFGSTQYGTIIRLEGDADHNQLINNTFNGISTTSTGSSLAIIISENASVDNTRIEGNTFVNGSIGIAMSGVNSTTLSSGTQILDNSFQAQAWGGAFLQYHNAPQVIGNTVTGGGIRGFELQYCDNGLQVLKNKITINSQYGIYFYYCDGGTGLVFPHGLVANNFVSVTGAGTNYGIYSYYNTYQDVYYNSINISQGYSSSAAFAISGTGNNVNIQNNIFANPVGGYAYYVQSAQAIGISDYNDYFTPGTYMAYWNAADITDLAALQTANSQDAHSISANPGYYSTTNLHATAAAVDSAALPLSLVTDDIDGEIRDANYPDMGADEFIFGITGINNGGITPGIAEIPDVFILYQNYPNPFNPTTHIRYGIPTASEVNIEVYNSLGQRVAILENDYQTAGYHVVDFDASRFASGIYFYRINAGNYNKVMKMMLMK
jgi:hypothetical protein